MSSVRLPPHCECLTGYYEAINKDCLLCPYNCKTCEFDTTLNYPICL